MLIINNNFSVRQHTQRTKQKRSSEFHDSIIKYYDNKKNKSVFKSKLSLRKNHNDETIKNAYKNKRFLGERVKHWESLNIIPTYK